MQEHDKSDERSLSILAPETDDRSSGAIGIVVEIAQNLLLPRTQLEFPADQRAFGDAAMLLDPPDGVDAAFRRIGEVLDWLNRFSRLRFLYWLFPGGHATDSLFVSTDFSIRSMVGSIAE